VHGKWTAGCKPLVVNDLVIVKEDKKSPARWKLARITSVHPESDGRTRVVTIRLANGNETKRPVVKLCHLSIEDEAGGSSGKPIFTGGRMSPPRQSKRFKEY